MMSDSDSQDSDTGRFKVTPSSHTTSSSARDKRSSASDKDRNNERHRDRSRGDNDRDRRKDDRRRSRSREKRKSPDRSRHTTDDRDKRYRSNSSAASGHNKTSDERNGSRRSTEHKPKSSLSSARGHSNEKREEKSGNGNGTRLQYEKKPGKLQSHTNSPSSTNLGPVSDENTHAVDKLQNDVNTDTASDDKSKLSSPTHNHPHKETEFSLLAAVVGPALPPHLLKKQASHEDVKPESISEYCGPALPPHLKHITDNNSDAIEHSFGPSLPPSLVAKQSPPPTKRPVIGPTLPANFTDLAAAPQLEEDDECMEFGPLPEGSSFVNIELEQRALELKINKLTGDNSSTAADDRGGREEWMLELPIIRHVTDLGLGARQFRTKEKPDFSNRSEWTETPLNKGSKKIEKTEKERQAAIELEAQREMIAKRDAEYERQSKKHKKKHKRDKSLMELHQKKVDKERKQKEKDDKAKGVVKERRRFDRDQDLQVNKFDEAQKKSVIKKAQLLDTRFSSSSGAGKYL